MTSGCAHPRHVWVCGRSAGRSDSCASREPPLQDWLDNWQPRGTPCGPLSSRACKPHMMTPPASQACGYPEPMRGVWHHQDRRRRGPRELTGIVDHSREGSSHGPLVGPGAGQVWHRVQELAGRARKRLPRRVRIATLDPFQGQQERHCLACSKDATSVRGTFHIVKLASDAPGEVRRRVQQDTTGHRERTGDPPYHIRLLLRASRDRLTKRR